MNSVMFNTEFIGTCQNIDMNHSGNQYYVAFYKGGFKYDDDEEFKDEKYECECSPMFDTFDEAFKFYMQCVSEFGRGNYCFADRAEIVKRGRF